MHDVKDIIAAEVGFTKESITFLYAQGKNLCLASLADVANADCWDVETVRALMGAGSLYITCKPYADEDIEVCSFLNVIVFISVIFIEDRG